MRELPTGTVTFLFTDIEGSTQLLHTLGDRYRTLQDRHAAILREAIADEDGYEVRTEGDSFFVVFRTPAQAVQAAVSAQRGLATQEPTDGIELRVRIGMHTGEGVAGGDDYLGIDVNRAARVSAAGHGGQVLLSDATRTLVADRLPDGVAIRALGSYRLKGIPGAERIHQLEIAGLPASFPPLRALDVRRSHLPPEDTTFIGRRAELRALSRLVMERRLLTLTGPVGPGRPASLCERPRGLPTGSPTARSSWRWRRSGIRRSCPARSYHSSTWSKMPLTSPRMSCKLGSANENCCSSSTTSSRSTAWDE